MIITPAASSSIRAINWSVTNNYVIRVNGVKKSEGTVAKSDSAITFTASDGSTVTVNGYADDGAPKITVSKDGTTYTTTTMKVSADYYYALGAPTNVPLATIRGWASGKTPKEFYQYCWDNQQNFVDYPDYNYGTFDELVEFAKSHGCPNSEISRVSDELNSGKISGFGYYKGPNGYNIVYYVSKLPLE